MGGKGRRRREKNYKAAHGDWANRLPPPPDPNYVDAIPAKLRRIMSISGAGKSPHIMHPVKTSDTNGIHSEEGTNHPTSGTKRKRNDQLLEQRGNTGNGIQSDIHEKETKSRKRNNRNVAHDLRFQAVTTELGGALSQRKQRKKQRLEDRKKKHKGPKTEEDDDFPRHEKIRFGDVVEAPPKLLAIPKPLKKTHGASQERLRIQAVEAYRNLKGWESRPGIQLPIS
ncbi:hypothetical protein M569_08247 [Genlisea aurea]|uniref:Uncharacterized protein n=1 Tax=Genlisea aurea TaxID=192259 RepID=S8CNY6_9LAMI|nr:hypothetical protein M569_08247 [Genlisea aurea]